MKINIILVCRTHFGLDNGKNEGGYLNGWDNSFASWNVCSSL